MLTFPVLLIKALRCEVLFPGALVASMTIASLGGLRTAAGKHLRTVNSHDEDMQRE